MTRQCECGYGEPLKGTRARRFVDNAHRMRARKARIAAERRTEGDAAAGSLPADRPAPSNGSMGRTRAGLELALVNLEPSDALKLTHCSGLQSFAIASRVVV
jgi:hypothetical protein